MASHPSLTGLRTFEVAARRLSFRLAADELGLSPTAVSHQIRTLEQALGAPLFDRHVRKVELTPRGRELAEALQPAFSTIRTAVERFESSGDRQVVTLGAGPLFASRWLVPRLDDFWARLPDIDLRLHHSPLPVYQQLSQFDLAIAWGDGRWPDTVAEPLLRIRSTIVLAPDLPVPAQPADLLTLPLLHQRNRDGIRQWLIKAGVSVADQPLPGGIFEDANVLLHAILDGKGAGLGNLPFIEDDLAAGRLVQPWPLAIDPGDAYYLIYRKQALRKTPVKAVRGWLQDQMKA